MLERLSWWVVIALAGVLAAVACQRGDADDPSASASSDNPSDEGTAPLPRTPPPNTPSKTTQRITEPTPAGEPGPFSVVLPKAKMVTAMGGFDANTKTIWVIYRTEEDPDECDKERHCTKWFSIGRERAEQGASNAPVELIESDTPSGIALDSVTAGREHAIVVTRSGVISGDEAHLYVHRLLPTGARLDEKPIELLGAGDPAPLSATASHTGDDDFMVCWQSPSRSPQAITALRNQTLWCRIINAVGQAKTPFTLTEDLPGAVRHHPSLAWGIKDHGVLIWVRDHTLEARVVSETGPVGDIIELTERGGAIARPPLIISGHEGFLVVWYAPDGQLWSRRLDADGMPVHPAVGLPRETGRYVRPDGIAVTPQAFLLALRQRTTTHLIAIAPDGQHTQTLRRSDESPRLRLSRHGVLRERQEGESKGFDWLLAMSLLAR